jgi:fluoride ion exporter CrcB/FEX
MDQPQDGTRVPLEDARRKRHGLLRPRLLEGSAPQDDLLLLVLGKGLLAGFNAFSTLMFETLNLARAREHDRAFFNVVGSMALGLPALLLGVYLGTVAR